VSQLEVVKKSDEVTRRWR